MKPRIFVSSTYYDLKYIRNNIERFIMQYGFEPVLFESGNVYFEPGKELDISCYSEVKQCHMMILLIGGRYGAPASIDDKEKYINNYEKNYISVTRKEFREAKENKIPIFIFIDKNVQAEYYTYSKNKELYKILTEEQKFEFAHVDNIHVFEFIEEVKNIAFCSFEKYLINQWSSMFYEYLTSLKEKNEANKILNTVSELQNVSEKINDMVDIIGKKILEDSGQYEDAVKVQNEKQIKFYCNKIVDELFDGVELVFPAEDTQHSYEVSEILVDYLFDYEYPVQRNGKLSVPEFAIGGYDDKIVRKLNEKLEEISHELAIKKDIISDVLMIYTTKIKSTFNVNGYKEYFKNVLEEKVREKIVWPF